MYKLKYDKIPSKWINGLPIGNGRLAAMYYGDENCDVLSLNHEYLWRGKYKNRNPENAADRLPYLRELLSRKEYFKASVYANLFFGGLGGDCCAGQSRIDSFQPAGDIVLKFTDKYYNNKSELDLRSGLISSQRGCNINGRFFCDGADGTIMARWNSDVPFCAELSFARILDSEAEYSVQCSEKCIMFYCRFICGIDYRVVIKFSSDGITKAGDDAVSIKDATDIVCSVNIILSSEDERLQELDFDKAYAAHIAAFTPYMDRVVFELDGEDIDAPTDERIERIRKDLSDDKLQELYFHYGRYLMVSSCICAKLPPNLQGKWNSEIFPPWKSDYHADINFQMNEWMIESANLTEFAIPLTDFMVSMIENGREAAKKLYGCRGIWIPHAIDVWRRCTPEAFGYAVWIGAAAWMAQPLWRHYEYTGDKKYLVTAYKYFKEVAAFYEDFLAEDENGIMQIMPSQSPENRFEEAGGLVSVGICTSSAIDVQLAYDALGYAIRSAGILKKDADKVKKWSLLQSKLPPFKIGGDGRLLEWNEELTEEQPGHKHLSHLYGLYPSDIFTPEKRKAEYDAAVKSFRYRISHQSGYTGWSRAWIANISARIGDAEGFYQHFKGILKDFATKSLLDIHPDPVNPGIGPDIFQIDGNFGMVSAVIEALCGFFDEKVHLLHAIPSGWKSGRLKGIKIPGGHTISFCWENGKVTELDVILGYRESVNIVVNNKEITVSGTQGQKKKINFQGVINR